MYKLKGIIISNSNNIANTEFQSEQHLEVFWFIVINIGVITRYHALHSRGLLLLITAGISAWRIQALLILAWS